MPMLFLFIFLYLVYLPDIIPLFGTTLVTQYHPLVSVSLLTVFCLCGLWVPMLPALFLVAWVGAAVGLGGGDGKVPTQ